VLDCPGQPVELSLQVSKVHGPMVSLRATLARAHCPTLSCPGPAYRQR